MTTEAHVAGLATADLPAGPAEGGQPPAQLAVRDVLWPAVRDCTADALAGLAEVKERTAVVLAARHATWATAEAILAAVHGPGARWLDPRSFLHYTAHSIVSELCMSRAVDGPSYTLTGASGLVDLLGLSTTLLQDDTAERVLALEVCWPTPLAHATFAGTGALGRLAVGCVVLEPGPGVVCVGDWRMRREPDTGSAGGMLSRRIQQWRHDPAREARLALSAGRSTIELVDRERFRSPATGLDGA